MKNIIFIQNPSEYIPYTSYIGYIPVITSREELYTKLSKHLQFPDYFGRNWNALNDLYRDFSWIESGNITIIHENLSELSFDDFKTYIEIMLHCVDYWTNYPKPDTQFDFSNYTKEELDFNIYQPHKVQFVFAKNEEKKIMSVIHECMQTCFFEHNLKEEDL